MEEPTEYALPVETLRPLASEAKSDSFVCYLEGMMAAACILRRAINGKVDPLVPKSTSVRLLRSDSWEHLGREVSRNPDLPLDPVPAVKRGRCGNGHEWIIEEEPTDGPIRCPICLKNSRERREKRVAEFTYRLDFAAGGVIYADSSETELHAIATEKNAQLVVAAFKAGLGNAGMRSHDAAHRVIVWLMSETGLPRNEVASMSVDTAIEKLAIPCASNATQEALSINHDSTDAKTGITTKPIERKQPTEHCKVLFFASNPPDTGRLLLDREVREIEAKIRSSDRRTDISLVSKWAVTPDDLIQHLNEHADARVLHFSGHGSSGEELVLADKNGTTTTVSKEALLALLATLGGKLRLVVLNACFSQAQAEAIVQHVDCAIGMSQSVGDDTATTFAASVYRAIGFGKSIKEAYDQGIAALLMDGGSDEVSTPRLLCKAGVDPRKVFLFVPGMAHGEQHRVARG